MNRVRRRGMRPTAARPVSIGAQVCRWGTGMRTPIPLMKVPEAQPYVTPRGRVRPERGVAEVGHRVGEGKTKTGATTPATRHLI